MTDIKALSDDDLELLGLMADRLDNAVSATSLPLPPAMHVEGMKGILTDVRDELRAFVVARLGHDPWEFHP